MANLAAVLKTEVTRLARKELRAVTDALRKTVASQRSEIVTLKRRAEALERDLAALTRLASKARRTTRPETEDADAGTFRFRAKGLATNRKRLGLSAEDFGLLIGASGQSVYLWERGETKPRPKNLVAIAALRGAGKREVRARLEALKNGQ